MTAKTVTQTDQPQSFCDNWKWRLSSKAVWIALEFLLLIVVLLATTSVDKFWDARSLRSIARTGLLFPALILPPMILVVASGGFDLSVGAAAGVVSVIMASMLSSGTSPIVALLVGVILGTLIGLVNGLLVGLARVHGAVATFGMMVLLRGVVLVITEGRTIAAGDVGFLGSLTVPGLVLGVLLILGVIVLTELAPFARKRYFGLREGGSWLQRLALTGLPYVLSGAMSGLAGACYVGLIRYGTIATGTGLEADVMLTVFLGGTVLGGGLVNGVGAVLAALIFAISRHAMMLDNQDAAHVQVIKGVSLVVFGLLCQLYYMIVGWIFKRVKSKEAPIVDNQE
jgi:ribose transport system permease protein